MDERALITTTLIFSVSAKTLVPFFLRKERPENAFLTLIKKHCKIVQKNKLCHSKQQQIDYLMIYDVIYLLVFRSKNWPFSTNSCKGFIVSLKDFLCFLKRKLFLYFRKRKPRKNSYFLKRKPFLYFRKRKL